MRVRRGWFSLVLPAVGLLAAALSACGGEPETLMGPVSRQATPEELQARAEQLARELLIVDTHVDVPYRLEEEWEDVSQRTAKGDFDYPRAVAGGLDAPFMSIYVPASFEGDGAKAVADRLIDMVEKIVAGKMDKFYSEVCLLEQPFVKNPDQTVGQMVQEKVAQIGENIQVRRFSRFRLGEGIEKRSGDLAAEVAATLAGQG